MTKRWLAAFVIAIAAAAGTARAQVDPRRDTVLLIVDTISSTIARPPTIWLVDDYPLVRARLAELNRTGPAFPLLRSTSSLLWSDTRVRDGAFLLFPQAQMVSNSAIPYSENDGSLWAGKGTGSRISGGAAFRRGPFTVVIAPEITTTRNDSIPPRTAIIPSPAIPPGRSAYSYPWYANGPYSLDMPLRFGGGPRRQLRPGQSSILADLGPVSFGFSTENEWWGPGIDNALILSNNAPGFAHLLLRSSHPLGTVAGDFEFRWLVGGLRESPYFDDVATNNTRSISAAAVVLRPRLVENLSVGLAHSVIGTSTGWGEIPFRWLDVFHLGGHPNDGAPYDSTLSPGGRDQMYSLFARWVLPTAGAEVYGEWGRLDFPRNLRDFLVQPNRGQAYTLGLQWTRKAFGPSGLVQLRIENTSLEQSLALANKFAGVWYTSRRVLQGFTNEGQVLGAAVGPGSSGQVLETNYFSDAGWFGVELGRTRYSEDVHQALPMFDYLRWCSHDVQLQWGVHAGINTRLGRVSARSLYQDRLNAYFQGGHGCPRSDGMVDIRNHNLTITFSPR
ncbi:MAG TPA: capsule assembly Wzi family protein [Gemmatimonadaceae bacterium]|nr:capsule assembly Wzi family protein [Gemmatimonadaceae bacterium]